MRPRPATAVKLPSLSAVREEMARRSLIAFTQWTFAGYEANWHHRAIAEQLDQVLAGTVRRVILCVPPQFGKSELVSRRFPAYALGCDPELRFIACSYSANLANDMSRDVQKIMDAPEYGALFPSTRLATPHDVEVRQASAFEVVGHRGSYHGAGVGGSITGRSADIAVIDDPVKNRQSAESEVTREAVWNWYTSTFTSRLFGETGRIVICLTRWHEDDLAGRLLRLAQDTPGADQWTVISFPAIAESVRSPFDPRGEGDPLWPSKYPVVELVRRRASMGTYNWAALYQQRPAPAGGGLFKREWFSVVDALPVGRLARCRSWDCAGTKEGGDYTAGIKIAHDPGTGRLYVEHAIRGQWSPGEVDRIILQTAAADGPSVTIREEEEGGSSGKAVTEARTKKLLGYIYSAVKSTGDKTLRAQPFAVQAEAGNVSLLRGDWNQEYLDELTSFPFGAHDDQVDASAGAVDEVAFGSGWHSLGAPEGVPEASMWGSFGVGGEGGAAKPGVSDWSGLGG